jgi:putative glutathione S-transferase
MTGQLIDGYWRHKPYESDKGGAFERTGAKFRNWITADGSSGFPAEPGRYHLYVSLACPWASRTTVFRRLKGLEDMISMTVVSPLMLENGWEFNGEEPCCTPDPLYGARYLHQIYTRAEPRHTGSVTVPVLWDKTRETIVSNESADIIRMFNSAFDGLGAKPGDWYPRELRGEIDAINEVVYANVNNGVYRCGFAQSQDAYDEAFDRLFTTLDALERSLSRQRYLAGDCITEADWRLFTTLMRFDVVYHTHFKCNLHRLVDYENLSNYARELYQQPGVAETVNFDHIKRHYYISQDHVNPSRIVARGPELDFSRPHDRFRMAA